MAEGSQPSLRPLPHQKRTFDDGDDDLHVFSYKGEYDRALLCLLKGTNCDVKNDWRQTPLHLATSAGHLNIMLLLLDSGACVNERDHQDLTPLHQAVIHGNKKCAELLLCFGGSPHNSEDIVDCRSPLELAETLPLIYSFIESKAGIVHKLQHLCRIAIRRIMGVTRRKRMRELPIPRQLISFLNTLPLSFADELLSDREKRRERKYAKKPPSSKSSSLVLQTLKEPL